MSPRTPIKNPAQERNQHLARVFIAALVFLSLLGILAGRLYYLQVARAEYYATRSNDNRMRVRAVPPARGLIYDRNGVLLADNVPAYRLEVVPEQVEDMDALLARLARVIPLSEVEIAAFRERLSQSPDFTPVPLKLQLSAREVARFEVNRHRFPGMDIRAGLARNYPLGPLTAHIVGYVGAITEEDMRRIDMSLYRGTSQIGKVGVERSYESALHGSPGSKLVEVNAEGRVIDQLDTELSTPGKTLYLTVDVRLQRAAKAALDGQVGAVVVIDPGTGSVLAMASRPSYDPQLFVEGISTEAFRALLNDPLQPMFHRALRGQYPPGSTIKPAMGLAGLETRGGEPIHERYCPGYYELPGVERRWRGWKHWGHGEVDLREAIMQSCDIYFYDLARELGIDRIHEFLGQFGLGRPTGIDLPGEQPGLLPSRGWKRAHRGRPWYPGETLNIGIGQGYMSATPLQLAHMTALVASRGHGKRPHIVRAVRDNVTREVTRVAPQPLEPLDIEPAHWQRVIEGMVAVVNAPNGTARAISEGLTYTLAGKSGTSQVRRISRDGDNDDDIPWKYRDHALFIAFAPVEDPEIAIAAIVPHGGSGSGTAAPVVRKVADAYFALYPQEPATRVASKEPAP